uniref:Uncharacterized protein n=1 Tax=Palpitomonas bilix TaxID=652834 RepID=A0A7S3LWL3_9EUKA|mmetsp:Transcript_7243/g.18812  ORF Transcript_7243/g.18812 Transcript_7243/m.18812 type:complete len:336 (+) Transcript_7243:385-1392(+)
MHCFALFDGLLLFICLLGPSYSRFTAAGAKGRYGPTLSQCRLEYAGQPWLSSFFTTSLGKQYWTVPADGTYWVDMIGAKGGHGGTYQTRSKGARVQGAVQLNRGDVLRLVVGQAGAASTETGDNGVGSGGGGSFVVKYNGGTETLLFAAGGGGAVGNNYPPSTANGQASTEGSSGGGGFSGSGGRNGGGGGGAQGGSGGYGSTPGGQGSSCSYGCGGGGYFSNGGSNGCSSPSESDLYGRSWADGMTGGPGDTSRQPKATNNAEGGFGGGAGVGHRAAGGGGYSGGGGDGGISSGGGGGSYAISSAVSVTKTSGYDEATADGYIKIARECTIPRP